MPPRRSCFSGVFSLMRSPNYCFNATTAFLLRCNVHAVESGCGRFNATTAFLLLLVELVELHNDYEVSMPPRRSCFATDSLGAGGLPGVSMPPRRSCFGGRSGRGWAGRLGFNATTAFLLQDQGGDAMIGRICFNATTAFLLPIIRFQNGEPKSIVSMPPRRSCFGERTQTMMMIKQCFNATTAFLLHVWISDDKPILLWFQCHHGVPASGRRPRAILRALNFQCHHGVPASVRPSPRR